MKSTKIITGIVILTIVGLLTVVVWGSNNKKEAPTNRQAQTGIQAPTSVISNIPIFFYGSTCPHCQEVEKWMIENKIEDKISITKKEVYDNKQNAQDLTQAAKNCGLPTDNIGVPFLYSQGKCFVGTPDVVKYLSEKAGVNVTERTNE